jgi:predicted Rossmann fold nucleotide-binding protein DprA/Smf involved in DNA uptake
MTEQLELNARYPAVPGARANDTSREAGICAQELAQFLRPRCLAAVQTKPQTADEVAELLGQTVLAVRPRFSELRKLGQVVDSGARRLNAYGNRQIVWRAVLL